MATAVHTIASAAVASPVLALVATEPTWADTNDVRAVASAIIACDELSAKLAMMPMGADASNLMGMLGIDLRLASTSRRCIQVARPSSAESVLGELWSALDDTRSGWIKAQLTKAGLDGVWASAVPASRDDLIRAHEMEGDLEATAPSVADVVNVARFSGREG